MMTECKVPVFVSPQSLTFSLEDKSSHRQIITLFNPYDFPVRFKVFCTCTKKYTVVEPEGSISASSRVDIVVRHNAPAPAFCDIRDKFRIQMQYYTTKKVIGHKDVETILVRSSDNFELPPENFKQ
ncbi:LOW QUALITY PROTEIN: motile sperm domain-containing protein 1-like, partial [Metopolophium dirhodum]